MSTNLDKTVEQFDLTARAILVDAMPQATNARPEIPKSGDEDYHEKRRAHRDWQPNAEASAQAHLVRSAADVKVGDVVIVIDEHKRNGYWSHSVRPETSIGGLLDTWSAPSLYVVSAVSAKMFTVLPLRPSLWSTGDVADLSLPTGDRAQYFQERLSGSGKARTVVHTTLTYDGLVAAIKADARYAKANVLAAKIDKLVKASDAQRDKERQATKKAMEPTQALADAINAAAGVDVFHVASYTPTVLTARYGQDALADASILRVLMAGRLALGETTQEQHDAGLAALATAKIER